LTNNPKGAVTIGRGKVIVADATQLAQTIETIAGADTFRISPQSAVEVIPYQAAGRTLIHLIRHEPRQGSFTLQLPATMKVSGNTATAYAPDLPSPKKLAITRNGSSVTITIPDAPIYSVVAIE
jgi:hypothetical protein